MGGFILAEQDSGRLANFIGEFTYFGAYQFVI
jgi:hypothetical protein